MTKKSNRRTYTSKPGCDRPIHPLPGEILRCIQLRAEAIGPLQAASEMAAMSSVMLEGYTDAGQLRAKPEADYDAFIARAASLLSCEASRAADGLRRLTWARVLQLADALGPFVAMAELAMQCGLMISACREAGWLKPGPVVSPFDFAKRADGTSLL
ncbi:hypothetical protein MKK67_03000 [Methylobacterium sp. J-072]|uniref:hypothetical protein n=1 Tax=Methylobacterium sp. J-072 TaxID=2836651 RepID=UPI001FBBF14B|nr:hypothetical protein [Methylobacterium sp. J-072]MCJ2091480.1 hypothetical protein [Methylobacterium sp. J-072]